MTEQKQGFFRNDQMGVPLLVQELSRAYERLEERPDQIWVGCSGGLDSMCLLAALIRLRTFFPSIKIHLAHVNYGLRGVESDQDAAFVKEVAQKWQLPCHILHVEKSEHPAELRGVQEWARDLRYRWFHSLMGPKDILALAHHEDDLVETILMRLCRGAGLKDWLGMRELRDRIWRPLLKLRRSELEMFATRENVPFRVDSSNSKLIYARNRVRLEILPALEEMYPGLRQNLRTLAEDARDYVSFSLKMASELSHHELLGSAPPAVVMQLIEERLRREGYKGPVSRAQLELVYEGMKSGSNLTVHLQTRVRIKVYERNWLLETEAFPLSERWKQYRSRLLGRNGLAKIAGGGRYVAAGSLEESGRIDDNERSDHESGLSFSERDEL